MDTSKRVAEQACREQLEQFFGYYPDSVLEKNTVKALRFLMASNVALAGKPSGWAAGIIYSLANRGRQACGVPGLLNREFEEFFGVSMGTIRKRAARVDELLTF